MTWNATRNTGRVIHEVNPDILITIEVENRPTLVRFNEQVLGAEFGLKYPHALVLDGNDTRGIDVGLLSRFPIETARSHMDEPFESASKTFSRDCPEFDLLLPGNERLVAIPNHFKSKRNGNDEDSENRRKAQAKRAHEIAKDALARSQLVLVGGDLNDTPDSASLAELLKAGFRDVIDHPDYPTDRSGTFGTGLANNKLDYLISSPALWATVETCGIERRGSYHPGVWQPFDTVEKTADEASDHHCVWMDVNL